MAPVPRVLGILEGRVHRHVGRLLDTFGVRRRSATVGLSDNAVVDLAALPELHVVDPSGNRVRDIPPPVEVANLVGLDVVAAQ